MDQTELIELIAVLGIGYLLMRGTAKPAAAPQPTTNNYYAPQETNGWDVALGVVNGAAAGYEAYAENA